MAYIIAVGNSGRVKYSADGVTWTQAQVGTLQWNAVAHHDGLWVIGGGFGTSWDLRTSSDGGATWTQRTLPTPSGIHGLAVSPTGKWVAVGASGSIWRSDNGTTWSLVGTGFENGSIARELLSVTWAGDRFIAVGENGSRLYSNADGSSWTANHSGSDTFQGAAFGEGRAVIGYHASSLIQRSDDGGVTWTNENVSVAALVYGLAYNGTDFAAALAHDGTRSALSLSADGDTWAGGTIPQPPGQTNQPGIAWSGSGWLLGGTDGSVYEYDPVANSWTTLLAGSDDGQIYSIATVTNLPPNAPAVTDQGPFNRAIVNRVTWTFSDADLGDSQSAAELRYRVSGAGTWEPVVNIPNPNQFWDSPAGTWVADVYEAQVRTADQAGAWGPWSSSFFITAADSPGAPTFTDPTNGQTIATDSYTYVISHADVIESEWTLYADNAGAIDTATILQGPVTKATGDLRSHKWTGLADGVPIWASTRVKGSDGLYGDPAQIRNPVSYTPPAEPTVTYTPLALGTGVEAVDVHIENPAPTGDQPAVSYNDVLIDDGAGFVRKATFVARNGTWRYWTPPHGWNPQAGIKVTAVGENGTTASTTLVVEVGGGTATVTDFESTIGGGDAWTA